MARIFVLMSGKGGVGKSTLSSSLAVHYARKGLKEREVDIQESSTPIIPIYTHEVFHTLQAARDMYDAGVYVNPVLPPATPPEDCLLRTSYMATHTETLLDEAMDIIAMVLKRLEETP